MLEAIAAAGSTTRPAIAKATGLSKPTVSQAVRRLLETGLIAENGDVRGNTGRVPIAYAIQPSVGFVVAIDVGGSSVRVSCADLYGESHAEVRAETRTGEEALPVQLVELVHEVLAKAGLAESSLLAIGVAAPGVVDPVTQLVSLAPNIFVRDGFDLTRSLREVFTTRVYVENNVNMAAVGEKWRGLGRAVDTFAFVGIGAGIGMGLIHNDQLWRGSNGAAGEISFLPLAEDPLDTRHRVRGGLEDQTGAATLLAMARQNRGWQEHPPRGVAEIFLRAEDGDPAAQALVKAAGNWIGLAIASICAVVDPGLVVLGGGIGANLRVREMVQGVVESLIPYPPRIETTELGEAVSLYGATSVALSMAREFLAAKA
ncbi:ROK family transcriptional regulator [Nonomuraea sp. NPDC049129]|uniref:ROK family transcriptional regulator n=1 Tax=Nonomuraea sp. NPDC049129 TaxID=3155272 RepID=UPI0033C41CAD